MNPKVKDFIDQNPNMTVLGLAWACYWRLMVAYLAIWVTFIVIMAGLASIIDSL